MSKTMIWTGSEARSWTHPLRHAAALTLRAASSMLARTARRIRPVREQAPRLREIEFQALYGEAGAPEGCLYIDGELVAVLPVKRL